MKKLASIILLAMMALSAVAVFSAYALPADSMWIEPTAIDGNTVGGYGAKFNVTIWLNVTTLTNSWQLGLFYNKAQLNATGIDFTGSGKSLWSGALPVDTVVPTFGSHDATYDYVSTGEVLKASAEKAGIGSLAWVEFQIIVAPLKYQNLSSELKLWVVGGAFNSFALKKGPGFENISLTFGKSDYTYAWIQPLAPNVSIGPDQTFGPAPPPAVGQTFTETLKIDSISADWGLHNATVDITGINTTLIEGTSFTKGAIWNNFVFNNATPGQIHIEVWNPSSTPTGPVIIGTLGFRVKDQGPFGSFYKSFFNLANIVLWDTTATIAYGSRTNATVTVNGLQLLPNAYLEVSSKTMGPGPAIGQLFNITVRLKNLDKGWFMIGLDFRLSYDPYYITPVAIYEGPMLPYFAALQPGSLGTWFIGLLDSYPPFCTHVLIGNLILPNGTGRWNNPFPNSTCTEADTVAYITFRVEYQSFGDPDQTSPLNIIDNHIVGLVDPLADPQDIVYLPIANPHNGTYTITTTWPGRMIDVYTQYPAPFGGQGLGMPSDMFWPQKQVELYANVTYNFWPVQQKDVAFEIRDPHGKLWAVLVARTDADGVAYTSFRIPWPCANPEDLFGVWTVVATVDVACVVVTDTLQFHFDYLVEIFKVTTDKFEYNHCNNVVVTIKYGTHAQQIYPLVMYVVIKDNLNVPIGIAFINTTIGGTQFCTYQNYTDSVSIHIDKFAFAGIAKIFATAYNKLPGQGGFAWCPTYGNGWPIGATIPEIAIQPY